VRGSKNKKLDSDCHDHSFGKQYGVLLEGLPLPLLTRAVFVLDASGKVVHAEYVPEVTNHPNYDACNSSTEEMFVMS